MGTEYLYLDNIRGFSNAILPLKEVNFLVGENSSGKSSVLGLLRIIQDMQSFWLSPEPKFNCEDVDFGNFDDIVSITSKERSYFRIGVLKLDETDGKRTSAGFLATFGRKLGLPTIRRYTCAEGETQVDFKFLRKSVFYKYQKPAGVNEWDDDEIRAVFEGWSRLHEAGGKGYRALPRDIMPSLTSLNSLTVMGPEVEGDFFRRIILLKFYRILGGQLKWVAPVRSQPKRTYDLYDMEYSPTGEHTPYQVRNYFRSKKKKEAFRGFVGEFGKDSGLFDGISIRNFGKGAVSPFEMDVEIGESSLRITDVGYGVSQSLPIIVEFFEGEEEQGYLLQQPEIHLHPRAQAALGGMMYRLVAGRQQKFVVETHSDFIIDRFRIAYRDDDSKRKDEIEAQVVFFERGPKGNTFHTIAIEKTGALSDSQPKAFREFFLKEQVKVLGF